MAEAIKVTSPTSKAIGKRAVPRGYSFEYYRGDNLDEAVELFGKDIIFAKFCQQDDTDLGNGLRRLMNEDKTDAELEAFIVAHKPGLKRVGKGGGAKKKAGVKEWAAEYQNAATAPERKAELKTMIVNYIAEQNAILAAITN